LVSLKIVSYFGRKLCTSGHSFLAHPTISLQQSVLEVNQLLIAYHHLTTDLCSKLIYFAPYLPSGLPISIRPPRCIKQQRLKTPYTHKVTLETPRTHHNDIQEKIRIIAGPWKCSWRNPLESAPAAFALEHTTPSPVSKTHRAPHMSRRALSVVCSWLL